MKYADFQGKFGQYMFFALLRMQSRHFYLCVAIYIYIYVCVCVCVCVLVAVESTD